MSLHLSVRWGDYDACLFALENGYNINDKDVDGRTLLHIAVCFGHKRIAELLLSRGACVDERDNFGC